MTWREIKQAVEAAGVADADEIYAIECERRDGNKSFHKAESGKMFELRERVDEAKADIHGCAS